MQEIENFKRKHIENMKLINELDRVIERWEIIEDCANYMVSTFGRVKNIKTNRILKSTTNINGYITISLSSKTTTRQTFYMHRLVAKAFLENGDNKLTVDHIDRNSSNNHILNLKWATGEEQIANRSKRKVDTVKWTKNKEKQRELAKLNEQLYKYFEFWKKTEEDDNYYVSSFGRLKKGNKILTLTLLNGYQRIALYSAAKISRTYGVNRLVAKYFIPNPCGKEIVDHIDGNPTNNNVYNLRWATNAENGQNMKIKSTNTSGVAGVFNWQGKWKAYINFNSKRIWIGTFKMKEEAIKARKQKEEELFGEFARK